MAIRPYEDEKGIELGGTLALASAPKLVEPFGLTEKALAYLKAGGVANPDQPDLFYLHSVLVTAGWGVTSRGVPAGWNENDDVFAPEPTYAAKDTPEDKPFDYEHDCNDIIGHITGQTAVGPEGPMVGPVDQFPPRFDIVTQSVIYRGSADAEREKRIAGLIDGIKKGEWKVSMEALFSGFDYVTQSAAGAWMVVPRTSETAYLTKHLRAYGGKGEYGGKRLGRLLKNIVFAGKGLVRVPANPGSVILDHSGAAVNSPAVAPASPPFPPSPQNTTVYSPGETTRGDHMELKEQLEKAQAGLAAAEKKAETAEGEKALAQARLAEAGEHLTKTKAERDAQEKLARENRESASAAQAEAKKLAEERDALKKELEQAKASLAQKDAAVKKADRAAKIKASLLCDDKHAAELAESLEELSDAKFDSAVARLKKDKPDHKALDSAKVNDEPALSTDERASRAKKAEELRVAMAKKLGYKESK